MSKPPSSITPAPETAACAAVAGELQARRLRLGGHVQGVGFRPFVYRLARSLGLAGSVRNLHGEVDIVVSGSPAALERFMHELIARAPPLARPRLIEVQATGLPQASEFTILASAADGPARIFVPADAFTCPECLAELDDPADRRYRYPFINCTQCGPRYTLIEALPYDRSNTTMSGFALCPRCAAEYRDPGDRRFHAEPVACPECGPSVWLESEASPGHRLGGEPALRRAVQLLLAGGVVAVKGIGGYHLLCDATSDAAVARLRSRKHRPDKPLAVMYPQSGVDGLAAVRGDIDLSEQEAEWLLSPARPIVLARRRAGARLSRLVAPGLAEVGVFLPYSPLHHLLLSDVARALVATSGNVSGEPVITEVIAARTHLTPMAHAVLHHDRPIARPADDTVVRGVLGRARVLRIGRGLGPLELALPQRLERPVLATGGHLKATVALAWEDRVVISPHIGDMGSARSVRVFGQVVEDLQRLYGVRATGVVCDAHPDYASSRWAHQCGLPVTCIPHHRAHASAVVGQSAVHGPMLVFTWDGTGLGEDGTLWGGEAFLGVPGCWRRVASLRPFRLPGGEHAARAPWRCAAGACWEIGVRLPDPQPGALVRQAWERGVNAPWTSAAGRLFDAAAAVVLGVREASYEGQGPMQLEAAAREGAAACERSRSIGPARLYRDAMGVLRLDWQPVIEQLVHWNGSLGQRALEFHRAIARGIVAQARALCAEGIMHVGLGGGVFQNALLTELACREFAAEGFHVSLCEQVPCSDGGLCYGQIIEYAARIESRDGSC
jgi:hydrogenase maturation protein HypF